MLTWFEKLPNMDAYRVGGHFAPYAVLARNVRFSDAELAAEYWAADAECAHSWVDGEHTEQMQGRFETIERFATHPHDTLSEL